MTWKYRIFLEVASMVVTWWIAPFFSVLYMQFKYIWNHTTDKVLNDEHYTNRIQKLFFSAFINLFRKDISSLVRI